MSRHREAAIGREPTPRHRCQMQVSEASMFDQTFVDTNPASKKPVTIAISLLLQVALLMLLTIIPLLFTRVLSPASFKDLLIAPLPPKAAVPEPPASQSVAKFAPRALRLPELYAPVAIPNKLTTPNEVAPAPDIGLGTAVSDANASPFVGVIGSAPAGPPPPPEPIAAKKEQTKHGPIRIGTLSEADLLRKVMPVYPPLAKSARVQGTVEFTALISKDGNIENLKLVHGHPLLVNAAREAVEQWKYRPTLLNGVPVEVITDIVVNFTLSQ